MQILQICYLFWPGLSAREDNTMADANVALVALGLAGFTGLMVILFFPGVRAAMGQMLLGTIMTLLAIVVVVTMLLAITGYSNEPL